VRLCLYSKIIISDSNNSFASGEFCEFIMTNNIKHVLIVMNSLKADSQAGRANRVSRQMLEKLTDNAFDKY